MVFNSNRKPPMVSIKCLMIPYHTIIKELNFGQSVIKSAPPTFVSIVGGGGGGRQSLFLQSAII